MMMLQAAWFILGLAAALLYLAIARRFEPKHERAILAQGLVIAALIYVGFAVAWGDGAWLLIEGTGVLLYSLFVVFAMRYSVVWLAVGWAAHSLWDVGLHLMAQGHAIAPEWYVIACLSFDLLVAGYIMSQLSIWSTREREVVGD